MAEETAQIDSTVEVVTPENIAFQYHVAGPFRRLPAFLIDLLVRLAIFALLATVVMLVSFGAPGVGGMVVIIAWFALDWFYGGVCETLMNGQTPGKRVMGLRVLTVQGQPINGVQAVMRNILRSADMMPMLSMEIFDIPASAYVIPTFMVGMLTMMLNKRFQRLGDLVCGTLVVVEERSWLTGVAKLEDARAAQLANYIPPDFTISRTLARSLSAYVDRRRFFSADRRREVAAHIAQPLIQRFGFPANTSYDLFLCALYYRAFIADRSDDDRPVADFGASPFAVPALQEAPPVFKPTDIEVLD